MKKSLRIIWIIAAGLLPAFILTACGGGGGGGVDPESGWDVRTVYAGRADYPVRLALDGSGNPHFNTRDVNDSESDGWFADDYLKYAFWDRNQWVLRTVAKIDDGWDDVGWNNSMVLDANGWPHISYSHQFEGRLKYARWDGNQWLTTTVADVFARFTSIALDQNGQAHISYYDTINNDLKLASWDGNQWNISTPEDDAYKLGGRGCTNLALDAAGRPHISYYHAPDQSLKYAHWDGSQWLVETVDGRNDAGEDNSLALDANGRPHISYYSTTDNNLKYAHWDGNQWVIETVDVRRATPGYEPKEDELGRTNSLALDSNDRPHILYPDYENDVLKYAHWDGAQWQIEIVAHGFNRLPITPVSLALDALNDPHLGFVGPNYEPMYGTRTPEGR